MKKIEAIIRLHHVQEVEEALNERAFSQMIATPVDGFVCPNGHTMTYRGSSQTVEHQPKVKIEMYVADERVDAAIETIVRTTRTGEKGDGKIFVVSAEEVMSM